jgi:hypothetical protein
MSVPRSGVNFRGFARKWPKIVNLLTDFCSSHRFSQGGHSTGEFRIESQHSRGFSLLTFASIFSGKPSIIGEGLSRRTGRFWGRVSSPGNMNNL